MDACAENQFQQLNSSPYSSRLTNGFFVKMLALSLTLHAISSVIVLLPRDTSMHSPPANYIDLKEMKFQEQQPSNPHNEQKEEKVDKPSPPVAASPTETVSEVEKLQKDVQQLRQAATESNPGPLQERSIGLGLTNGYFSSIAEGDSLRSDIREYYFTLLREVNEKWWLNKENRQGGFQGATITITIARDGTIVQKMLVRRSGNPAFDKAILQTLEAASPLAPLPVTYEKQYFSAPIKFVGPLSFFR